MNKQIISDTAYRLFSEKGYDQVSVMEICKECKITKPTFYHYVESKEALLTMFYDDITIQIASNLGSLQGKNTAWRQFLYCFEMLMEQSFKVGYDITSQLLISNLKVDSHSFDLRPELTSVMISIITRAQQNGEINNTSNPEQLYHAAAHMFTGYEFMWCLSNGMMNWKKNLFTAFDAIFMVREDLRQK